MQKNTSAVKRRRLSFQNLSNMTVSLSSIDISLNDNASVFNRGSQFFQLLFQVIIKHFSANELPSETFVSMRQSTPTDVKNKEGYKTFVASLESIHQISRLHPELVHFDKSTTEVEQHARSAFRFKERLRRRAYSQKNVSAKSRIRSGTYELLSSPPESQCSTMALAMHAVSIVCLGHTLLKQVTVIYESRDSPFINIRLDNLHISKMVHGCLGFKVLCSCLL